ncbi:MAG: hypothetical protein GXO63_03480, partial [Candidatus Micrarchaeota archaeon]|nr:hypothetical protein [Candidatus Micrarchaeota archaeon]
PLMRKDCKISLDADGSLSAECYGKRIECRDKRVVCCRYQGLSEEGGVETMISWKYRDQCTEEIDPKYCLSRLAPGEDEHLHVTWPGMEGHFECTLYDFNLPQKITAKEAQEWIISYGDPKYLVYWEKWPAGEESAWMSRLEWAEQGVKLWLIAATGQIAAGCLKVKTLEAVAGNRFSTIFTKLEEKIKKILGIDDIKKVRLVIAGATEKGIKAEVRNAKNVEEALKNLGLKNTVKMKKLGIGIAGVSGLKAIENWLDSVTFKFETSGPKKIFLVRPGKVKDEFDVSFSDRQMQMFVDTGEGGKPFYSVSPCRADYVFRFGTYSCKDENKYDDGEISICAKTSPPEPRSKYGIFVKAENKDGSYCYSTVTFWEKGAQAIDIGLTIATAWNPVGSCAKTVAVTAVGSGVNAIFENKRKWP